jgi:hypothetical protein
MGSQPSGMSTRSILSWSVSLALLVALGVIGYKFQDTAMRLEDIVGNIARQNQILSQMKANLLKSVEAEKHAVLSDSDEDSEAFAAQSRKATAEVEQHRRQLGELLGSSKDDNEQRLSQDFDRCWTEFQKIQPVVLELAVQNTNLKAARLSQTKADAAVQRFGQDLSALLEGGSSPGHCEQMVAPVFRALRGCLRIHYLHMPHINAAADKEMDQIEVDMKRYNEEVSRSLATLSDLADDKGQTLLADAGKAYSDFIEVTQEVLRLSRENTNIKSMELTLGKGRVITAECEGILTELQESVRNKTFRATR